MTEEDDKSLGDFFAKKDKSKKPKKKKKTKSSELTEAQSEANTKTQGDEWNDFEEEKEKDYSSLKIQDLQVTEDAKEDMEEESVDDEVDDEGNIVSGDSQTIWNTPTGSTTQSIDRSVEPVGTQNVVGGKYVPPCLKRATMASQQPKRRPGVPPDIKSQSMFPTLGAANQELGAGKTPTDFEIVKRGTRSNDARLDDSKPNIDLGNRYDGLRT